MTGLGLSILSFTVLELSPSGEDWHLTLRRTDFAADSNFADCHGRTMGPLDVARFLPNWASLEWRAAPHSLLSRSESWAHDEPYRVNIRADVKSSRRHHDVIAAFNRFMKNE